MYKLNVALQCARWIMYENVHVKGSNTMYTLNGV